MRYIYKVTAPMLPPGCKDHTDSYRNTEWWLNDMDRQGWEFVGYAEKHWIDVDVTHSLYIFRKPRPKLKSKQAQ